MEYCSSFLRLLKCILEFMDNFGESPKKALEGYLLMALMWSVTGVTGSKGRELYSEFMNRILCDDENLHLSDEYNRFL